MVQYFPSCFFSLFSLFQLFQETLMLEISRNSISVYLSFEEVIDDFNLFTSKIIFSFRQTNNPPGLKKWIFSTLSNPLLHLVSPAFKAFTRNYRSEGRSSYFSKCFSFFAGRLRFVVLETILNNFRGFKTMLSKSAESLSLF